MFQINIIQFLFSMDQHINHLKKAEKIKRIWLTMAIAIILSMMIYGFLGVFGVGSNFLLSSNGTLSSHTYESSKFWFLIGKVLVGLIFAIYILFFTALLFKWLTNIAFKKLLVMQLLVLCILLIERIIWFFLALTAGLDWHLSIFSFGILFSYFTEKTWIITLFGTISLFQIWSIWFQIHFLTKMMDGEWKNMITISVILLHLAEWVIVALLTVNGATIISRWFG